MCGKTWRRSTGLPADIRRLLQEAPEPLFYSQSILDTIDRIGTEKTYALIAKQIFKTFGVMTGPARIAQDRRNRPCR